MSLTETSEVKEYYEGFHALSFPLKEETLTNVWNNKEAREGLKKFLSDGVLKSEPELAKSLIDSIDTGVAQSLHDEDILKSLKRLMYQGENENLKNACFDKDEIQRVRRRVLQLSSLFRNKPNSYLDIGCGNGNISSLLTGLWKLPEKSSFAADVHKRISGKANYTYLSIGDGKIPLKSKSVELATMLMTLHHEENPDLLLKEAFRVIKPGGILVIREHDAGKISDLLLFEAIDTIYFSLFNDLPEVPRPGKYRTAKYWESLAHRAGFVAERTYFPEEESPMKPVHIILRKPV